MAPFDRKYSATRRQAVYKARFEQGMTYARIAEKAKTGELLAGDPFEIPPQYVGDLCRAEEKKRAKRYSSPMADRPHRDAIEELRRGLISAADDLLADYRETARKRPRDADPARGREIARLIREAAAIPAKKEETPAAPGQKREGQRVGGETRHGTAGSLLAAHRTPITADAPVQTDQSETPPTTQGEGHGSRMAA